MIALLVAVAVAVPVSAQAPESPEGDQPTAKQVAKRRAALREARSTWRRRRLHDYRYRVQRLCFCPATHPVRITVRDGRPRGTPDGFEDLDTVGDLFRTVEGLVKDYEVKVRYDGRGVPRRIEADPIPFAFDDGVTYVVSRFRRLRPAGR